MSRSTEARTFDPRPRPSAAAPARRNGRSPAVRADLVARIRAEIAAGTYDNESKVDTLLDSPRLARDLAR